MTKTTPTPDDSKQPGDTPENEAITELVDSDSAARAAAHGRAIACSAEIDDVLAKYRCRIMPRIEQPEPVGHVGNKIFLTASYWIAPLT